MDGLIQFQCIFSSRGSSETLTYWLPNSHPTLPTLRRPNIQQSFKHNFPIKTSLGHFNRLLQEITLKHSKTDVPRLPLWLHVSLRVWNFSCFTLFKGTVTPAVAYQNNYDEVKGPCYRVKAVLTFRSQEIISPHFIVVFNGLL